MAGMKNGNGRARYLIIDFDSTFVRIEALDNLAGITLENNPNRKKILEELEAITKKGMNGEISFPESLGRRLKMFSANKNHIKKLIARLRGNITESILKNKRFFKENAEHIYIISGGFKNYIIPIAEEFGILEDHILANEFCYNRKGEVAGVDEENFLAQEGGKTKAAKALGLKGEIWVVGDGYTDFEIKKAGCADVFAAFTENITRDVVVERADFCISCFDEIITLFYCEPQRNWAVD